MPRQRRSKTVRYFGQGAEKYTMRDEFTTDRAGGAVDGTSSEPGPGTRIVALDTESKLSIAGGKIVDVNKAVAAWDEPSWSLSEGIVRAPGKLVIVSYTSVVFGSMSMFGVRLTTAPSGARMQGWFDVGGGTMYTITDGVGFSIFPMVTGVAYPLAIVLRAAGCYYMAKVGGVWKLYDRDNVFNDTPVYFIYRHQDQTSAIDYVRAPQTLWLPAPLCYDTFTRADAALGTSEVVGPDGQSATAQAWTATTGTWGVDTNKAMCSALAGGIGIATVNVGVRNIIIYSAVTVAGGTAGIVASYVDANNYIYAYHNAVNATLVKVVGGVPTTLVDAAAAYGAGLPLQITIDGNSVSLLYNGLLVGATQTVADAGLMTGTKCGLFTTDITNSLDTFLVFARGTSGEYATLDKWSA